VDVVSLLERAAAAGLKVSREGDRLVVRGPKSAESLAKELLRHKPAVIAALGETNGPRLPWNRDGGIELDPKQLDACKRCGSTELWRNGLGNTRCLWCDPPATAMNFQVRENENRNRLGIGSRKKPSLPAITPCDRCHSTDFVDTSIHGGRSIRRDCAQCGLTIGFPMWFGKIDGRLRPN
jgi:hypothetical protein